MVYKVKVEDSAGQNKVSVGCTQGILRKRKKKKGGPIIGHRSSWKVIANVQSWRANVSECKEKGSRSPNIK